MADISSITLPGGGTYNLKDKNAVPKYGMGKNLLRNWYFVGGGTSRGVFPVNQRGQTVYTANGYRIDGWTSGTHSGTVTLNATGISIYSSPGGQTIIRQLLDLNDELDGKTCTMSVLTENGVFTGTGVLTISATSTNRIGFSVGTTGYVNVTTQTGTPILVDLRATSGNTIEYIATKLELGTEQTLAHQEGSTWILNEIPDYEYELYRCITSTADSSDTYANKSLATEQQLALVEQGATASQNLAIGDYFLWSGLSYRVNGDPIPAGGTIAPGENCVEDKVSGHAYTASIANGQTYVLNGIRDRMCILAFKRNNNVAVYLLDYWAANGVLVAGSPINGISVTKSANSSTVTISNSTGFAMAYTLIR